MTALAQQANGSTAVARPLTVLVPLIQQDIEAGKEAERNAGMPYYKAAGEKLLEAKDQMRHGEFIPWVERNFNISKHTAALWIRFAEQTKSSTRTTFDSLNDFRRYETNNPNLNRRPRQQEWHEPVKQELSKVDEDYLERQRQKRLEEEKERRLERELANKIIDIGYKALATKLHPDKGGSSEAMHRLQRVKTRLKAAI